MMLSFCNCGEDLALAEMFAETAVMKETVVVSSSSSAKPTASMEETAMLDQREGNDTKRNVSDYFGQSSRTIEDRAVYHYETRIVYKEIQDDSWMYDDLRLFTYDYNNKGDDDENDISDSSERQMPLHIIDRREDDEKTETHGETPATTTIDDNSVVDSKRDSESQSRGSSRKRLCASDRMETPFQETNSPEVSSSCKEQKKKKRKKFLRATDRDETPYMPVDDISK
eukprot:CAMPEP_0113644626 /NCGR_PEP_ID=MMETSP0017_2-20120614/23489_1 /TAXON_ID=2856 /ORGANISM="Cylindrotheca closterium" /LENGTH=226 /DNA_ID=CAMNT_0000556251 /DNA_START=41 /DNA_END=721 /DNA_ORIENTATION=+ /assembly_acc=CAM_ASM_000147